MPFAWSLHDSHLTISPQAALVTRLCLSSTHVHPCLQADELERSHPISRGSISRPRQLVGWWASTVAWAIVCSLEGQSEHAQDMLHRGALSSWDGHYAALLETYQRQQRFRPAISAHQLHQLFLLLRCEVRQALVDQEAEGSAAQRALMTQQAAEYAQLCQLHPGSPAYQVEQAYAAWQAGQPGHTAPAPLAVLRLAKSANCEQWRYCIGVLRIDMEGPTVSRGQLATEMANQQRAAACLLHKCPPDLQCSAPAQHRYASARRLRWCCS